MLDIVVRHSTGGILGRLTIINDGSLGEDSEANYVVTLSQPGTADKTAHVLRFNRKAGWLMLLEEALERFELEEE